MSVEALEEVRKLALSLMHQHGLHGWLFRFDWGRNRLGACHFTEQTISLSRHLVALNGLPAIRDTLLHEIAHALVGPGHGHDATWRAMAKQVGATPSASADDSVHLPLPAWQLWCAHCETLLAHRHRRRLRLRNLACKHCGPELSRLVWRPTPR